MSRLFSIATSTPSCHPAPLPLASLGSRRPSTALSRTSSSQHPGQAACQVASLELLRLNCLLGHLRLVVLRKQSIPSPARHFVLLHRATDNNTCYVVVRTAAAARTDCIARCFTPGTLLPTMNTSGRTTQSCCLAFACLVPYMSCLSRPMPSHVIRHVPCNPSPRTPAPLLRALLREDTPHALLMESANSVSTFGARHARDNEPSVMLTPRPSPWPP